MGQFTVLAVDGDIDRKVASLAAAVSRCAARLEPDNDEEPVVVIDKADNRQEINLCPVNN